MAPKGWINSAVRKRRSARTLDLRTITELQDEVIRSQMQHGDSAMLTLRSDLDNYGYRLGILVEEVGEVGKAVCEEQGAEAIEAELYQVGAMALCWAEASRRKRVAELERRKAERGE